MEPDQPLAHVRSGMRVVDSSGEEVGTVILTKMGDPDAVTSAGQDDSPRGGLVEGVADVLGKGEPDVPAPLAERLQRVGYLKVDASGLFARDLYVEAGQVAEVTGDEVRLSVNRDELIAEG